MLDSVVKALKAAAETAGLLSGAPGEQSFQRSAMSPVECSPRTQASRRRTRPGTGRGAGAHRARESKKPEAGVRRAGEAPRSPQVQENENAVRPVGRELRGAGDPGDRRRLAARGGQGLSGISLRGEKIQRNLSTPSKECPAGDSILIKRKNSLKKDEKECG